MTHRGHMCTIDYTLNFWKGGSIGFKLLKGGYIGIYVGLGFKV